MFMTISSFELAELMLRWRMLNRGAWSALELDEPREAAIDVIIGVNVDVAVVGLIE